MDQTLQRFMEIEFSIVQVLPGEDFTVYAYCNDGTVRLFDAKPLIAKGGVFSPLGDPDFFRSRLAVMNGTIAWDIAGNRDETTCVDIDPYTIFTESQIVDDPLETVI